MNSTVTAALPLSLSDLQAVYLDTVLPAVEHVANYRLRHWADGDRTDEIKQEATALAWKWVVRLNARGKDFRAWPMAFAVHLVRAVLGGTGVCGKKRRSDMQRNNDDRADGQQTLPMGRETQLDGAQGDEDDMADFRHANPAEQAAMRLDLSAWLATFAPARRALLCFLAAGERTQDAAEMFGLTWGRISQIRREALESWTAFQGE